MGHIAADLSANRPNAITNRLTRLTTPTTTEIDDKYIVKRDSTPEVGKAAEIMGSAGCSLVG